MESCPQMLGIAVESLVISAAVAIQMRGSGVAGLVGRASAGRGFQILGAEETELGEGPLVWVAEAGAVQVEAPAGLARGILLV